MNSAHSHGDTSRPLVVDLDGTLLRTDLLIESFLHLLATHPVDAIRAIGALRHGKAALKARIADQAVLDMGSMPLDTAVCDLIAQRRAAGGQVILASASDARFVQALAGHLGWFDAVFGTEHGENLSGAAKARLLVARYGAGGFDYAGNALVDLHVWEQSHTAYLAGGSNTLAKRLTDTHDSVEILPSAGRGISPYLKAMRPHQWLKNVLVFVPAAAGHTLVEHLPVLILAFLAFSLCAAGVYICNDLLDLSGDRDHPRKQFRSFASGAASPGIGAALAVLVVFAAFALSLLLPWKFGVALFAYFLLTMAYSLYFKRRAVVDVIVLACLYGMRMAAGGYASDTILSHWLAGLAIFLFLSLALVKRCAELVARLKDKGGEISARGYRLDDLPVLEAMAAAAGYNSALVLALYVNSAPEREAYAHPDRLWFLCVLLLAWISRILVLTRRGEMNDDPVVFALRDRWSLFTGALSGVVILAAWL